MFGFVKKILEFVSGTLDVAGDVGGWMNILGIKGLDGLFSRGRGQGVKASSEIKSDDTLPKGLLTEKFTKVDDSYWQAMMTLVDAGTFSVIQKLVAEMKRRDDEDRGRRVDSFRVGVLIMPNRVTEEVVTKKAQVPPDQDKGASGASKAQRDEKKPGKSDGPQETVIRKNDPRFTDKDLRILYLKRLAGLVSAQINVNVTEAQAIASVIDSLEADGFLTTGKMRQQIKEEAEKTLEAGLEEVLRFRLGKTYERIGKRHTRSSEKQLQKLRLQHLQAREERRARRIRTGDRKRITPRSRRIITIIVGVAFLTILSGILFH